ncbi:MAG: CoA-binding protein [Candidatus Kariarchaeaceae archaeon]|jgi:predicted CoA-binding protein
MSTAQEDGKIKTDRQLIDEFLALNRIAFVGVSRNSKDFSVSLFKEFQKREFDIIPVNPKAEEIHGIKSYSFIKDIQPKVDGAIIMTPPNIVKKLVEECAAENISKIWLYRGVGKGSVSSEAIDYCNNNNVEVVPGYCPFMFFDNTGIPHKLHGMFKKLFGSYPKH